MSRWAIVTPVSLAEDDELARAVEAFVPVDRELGVEAGTWLREDAAANDGSTKTYVLLSDGRAEGFVALCASEVRLTRAAVADLGLPARVRQPAILLAWIARHQEAPGVGELLLRAAFDMGRAVARDVGAVALVVDPGDDGVAEYWRGLGFRDSRPRWEGAELRLWMPLQVED